MDFVEFSAKNVDDAITEACKYYIVASDSLEYEVISEGSTGFLGFNSKPAVIKARVKEDNPVVEEAPAKEAKSEIKKEDKKEKSEKKVEAAAPAENKQKEDKPRKPLNVDASEIENENMETRLMISMRVTFFIYSKISCFLFQTRRLIRVFHT